MTKEAIRYVKNGLNREKLFNALECVEFLEKENEKLEHQVSYLEDNLRVTRKDREHLQDTLAKEIKDFITEQPFTSLRFLANEQLKQENEKLKQQIEKMKCCGNCKFQDMYGDCVLGASIWCNKIYECGSDEWELADENY